MSKALISIFRIPDLRNKILFTLGIIIVYRLGAFVPTPGIDGQALSRFFDEFARTQGSTLFGIMNMFTGGAMKQLTVFALGIMPYISASIILQLLTSVVPQLEKLAKEPDGRQKMTQYTRYATVILCVIQAFFISMWLENPAHFGGVTVVSFPGWGFRFLAVITLTAGTMLIMWLGEMITAKGIGNGISLIITAGIVSRMPAALSLLVSALSPLNPAQRQMEPVTIIIMLVLLVGVIVSVILITQGQRKIPVQYAKRVVGRKVYGGQSTYIPLRVNMAGVIPIIFAQSLILFPATIAGIVPAQGLRTFASWLTRGQVAYTVIYSLLIIFFTYFYTAVVFNPQDAAENMKRYGGFVPGIRPGKATAEYFEYILGRITLPGAIFLAFIAVFPDIVGKSLKIPSLVASFLGGTGILIIVGVMLDTMRQIESQLLMRHYEGFMQKGRLRGRR
ncbi:MAG: preprotein translocase subunit SecY [Candidatus Omnitrophota bacterium]